MWELDYKESWAWRIDAFELWCWRRLLRVPWTARRSNQSILKEIRPGCSLEGLMLKLIDVEGGQCFGHLIWRPDSFEKTLMLEKIEGRRRRGRQRMVGCHHRLDGHGFGWTLGVGDGQGGLVCCSSWGHKESDMTEWVNWTNFSDRNLDMDSVISILTPQEWSDSIPRSQKQWVLVLSLKFPQFLHWTQSFLTTQGHLGWNYNLCFMRELKFFIKFWKKNQRFLQNKSP